MFGRSWNELCRGETLPKTILQLVFQGAPSPAGFPASRGGQADSFNQVKTEAFHIIILSRPVNSPFSIFSSLNCTAVDSAQRVGFFNIGSGWVGYWKKYRVAGRVRVG